MLTVCAFLYAGILAASVTYAAVTGVIDFSGTATTSADLSAIINSVRSYGTSPFGSTATATITNAGQSMSIVVDLRAPGDQVNISFDFLNDGNLPVEFEAPVIEISGMQDFDTYGNPIMVNGNPLLVHPVMIEGFVDAIDGTLDFEDVDGYTFFANQTSSRFGMAFIWDEDVHVETIAGEPITFTIEFPFIIGDIAPPAPPVVTP